MPLTVANLVAAFQTIAPPALAEPWDNVGLLAGDWDSPITHALVCIDYTAEIAAEGRKLGCDAVVAYHPPIFEPLKRLTAPSPVYDAIRRGLAIYSPHTAWDVVPGGVNDFLADLLGLAERRPLRPAPAKPSHCKLAVFTPAEVVDQVAQAMFAAGAGRIGNYAGCSFRTPGTGTFFGETGTNPAVGQAGRWEQVPELRLEVLVPLEAVDAVVAALRRAHPYEEPAFDLLALHPAPGSPGQGRIGPLDPPVDRAELLERLRAGLGTRHLLVAGPRQGVARSAACLAGAGGEHLKDALEQGADVYLTGEMRHHDALRAAQRGVTVVCALHSNSERASLPRLAERVGATLPELKLTLATADRDPFEIV